MKIQQSHAPMPAAQSGYVLLPVVLFLAIVAASAMLLSSESGIWTHAASSAIERDRIRYVAEAGLAHAAWQLAQNTTCADYGSVADTDFFGDSYSATFTPGKGSPVTITATGNVYGGASTVLTRSPVRAYQPPAMLILPLDGSGQDTILDDFYAIRNYGGVDYLQVSSGLSWQQRAVLRFDLAKIPAGVQILSARLELRNASLLKAGRISAHRMTAAWTEGTKLGGGIADGATWTTHDGVAPWISAGGDFDPDPVASTQMTGMLTGGWVGWEIGALVADWAAGVLPNHGLLLQGDGIVEQANFASKESKTAADVPRLVVTYACECGVVCGAASPTTLDIAVSAPDDDAEENAAFGIMYLDSSDLELAIDGFSTDVVGMRFAGVAVPPGSSITDAWVQFQVNETDSGSTSLVVRGEASDDAATFTTSGYDISSRPVTTAFASWSPPAWTVVDERGPDQRTPSIAGVIQEIVDRPGWADGNAIVIIVSGSGTRTADAYEADPAGAATLHLEYTPGGGGSGGGGSGGGGSGGGTCSGTFRDEFNARSFSGSNGSLPWPDPWQEVGESNGPTSGDIAVLNDVGNYQLRTRDNDNGGEGVQRETDLSEAGSATLSYLYRRNGLDNPNDYTTVDISATGSSGPWTELARYQGPGSDSNYQSASHDITAYLSANTTVRFLTSSGMGNTDTVWFDDVQIECLP